MVSETPWSGALSKKVTTSDPFLIIISVCKKNLCWQNVFTHRKALKFFFNHESNLPGCMTRRARHEKV